MIMIGAMIAILLGAIFVALRYPHELLRKQLDAERITDARTVEQALESYFFEHGDATNSRETAPAPILRSW